MVGLPHPANLATASIVKRVGPSLANTSVAASIIAWCSSGLRRFPVLGRAGADFFRGMGESRFSETSSQANKEGFKGWSGGRLVGKRIIKAFDSLVRLRYVRSYHEFSGPTAKCSPRFILACPV